MADSTVVLGVVGIGSTLVVSVAGQFFETWRHKQKLKSDRILALYDRKEALYAEYMALFDPMQINATRLWASHDPKTRVVLGHVSADEARTQLQEATSKLIKLNSRVALVAPRRVCEVASDLEGEVLDLLLDLELRDDPDEDTTVLNAIRANIAVLERLMRSDLGHD